ncbi:fibronectin type III domain-containing protein [Desulfuromonas acetoxidans]|uniref:Fibronectin type-III domain-containing protein n=1 Tax=Desulfuromonas acetoxidans (strain DSM 684 / 11070) TaxID=281689 RepID=Q1K081_DESA6|nr:fibronectin type III domain-containing protein [Desulfuromonas acetoxidans]EAT16060.1 hypothetical protein Dace_2361 [Desulfuromonas acetoxidans DSM 684]MBF0647084.1 fibronectin type III domain-containing protein [Desulfuromonas acetoxidans]NVD26203.1 fibronectin type III domain-containing protein [Desulfuromonas acetoxidans]NVE18067.1 fibronectin type III domain-containing protein [Desulfuromonas acetoxidans]
MRILHSKNQLEPFQVASQIDVEDGATANQVVSLLEIPREQPVILLVNNVPLMRVHWNDPLPVDAEIRFVEVAAAASWIPYVVMLLLSLGSYLYSRSLATDGVDYGTPASIYSFNSGSNRLRIGDPFCEHFGRRKVFPDLAQQSYVRNIDNDQYLYFLGFLGVGDYDVEGVYVDNTPLADYADTSFAILPPGTLPTLVTNVVWTCNEVSNQELSTDHVTYAVSAAGTRAYHIEFDITFSAGLVRYNSEGKMRYRSVTVATEVRTINDAGNATSEWTTFATYTFNARSKDPLRYSHKIAAPLGLARYEFRARRTTEASGSSKVSDKCYLTGLRAYGGKHEGYGDVTMIEAVIKASDQLNGGTGSEINTIQTRKLTPVTATGFGTSRQATRSIVDAVAYMVVANNGGNQDTSLLDFEELYELRTEFSTLDYTFDYSFDRQTNVMDATAKAADCGLSVPYLPGGLFSLVRDKYQATYSCAYNEDALDKLKIVSAPRTADAMTCVDATYVDQESWDDVPVTCLALGGSTDKPQEVSLAVGSRQQAYEVGMQIYLADRYRREAVEFETGLLGRIPKLFSKIIVPCRFTGSGQSGVIAAAEGTDIWLSEPVDFQDETEGVMYVSTEDGAVAGPYIVTPTDYAHRVSGNIASIKTIQADNVLATRYLFAPSSVEPLAVQVKSITPRGNRKIKISGVVVHDEVYANQGNAPDRDGTWGETATILLSDISLSYLQETETGQALCVTWAGAAAEVLIEINQDFSGYTTLEDHYSDHALTFETTAENVTVQITAYEDENTLSTTYIETAAYEFMVGPTGLTLVSADDAGIVVSWDAYSGAESYDVELLVAGEEITGQDIDPGVTTATISGTQIALLGGPWTSFTIQVTVIKTITVAGVDHVINAVSTLDVSLDPLIAPINLVLQSVAESAVTISWDAIDGATSYLVCLGTTTDFTPASTNVVATVSALSSSISGLDLSQDYYLKVAGRNIYYSEPADLVFSAALPITPETIAGITHEIITTSTGEVVLTSSGDIVTT